MFGQILQTQIKLLLKEQSDQGLHSSFVILSASVGRHIGRISRFEFQNYNSNSSKAVEELRCLFSENKGADQLCSYCTAELLFP